MNLTSFRLLKRIVLYNIHIVKPTFAQFVVTNRCNLNCSFCFIPEKERRKNYDELNMKEIFDIIDFLYDFGIIDILITGGEPLLRNDIIEIGKYVKSKRFISNLISNGTLINKNNARKLCRYFDTINISLDGFEHTHNKLRGNKNAYRLTMRSIKILSKYKGRCSVGIATTLMKENINEIIPLFQKLNSLVDFVGIQPIHFNDKKTPSHEELVYFTNKLLIMKMRNPRYIKNTSVFIKLIPKFLNGEEIKICDAGRLYFTISPDGLVLPCLIDGSKIKNNVKCSGCLARCTTDISLLFRNPLSYIVS